MSPVVTEDRVEKIVNQMIEKYERNIGSVRHAENTSNFTTIFEILNQMKGALGMGKVIGSIVAFLCMAILALLSYIVANRDTKSTMITSDTSVVAQQTADVPSR